MYIEPTHEALRAFLQTRPTGPVSMLNLLRFRPVADYSGTPELAPPEAVSGAAAYQRYMAHAAPFIANAGAGLRLLAHASAPVIGPPDERWDMVLLVRYPSAQAFVAFATDARYLAGVGHRTAALADSRLIPLTDVD